MFQIFLANYFHSMSFFRDFFRLNCDKLNAEKVKNEIENQGCAMDQTLEHFKSTCE